MKRFTIILTILISIMFLTDCTGSAEKRETKTTPVVNNTNSAIAPQTNAPSTANTTVKSADKDADDVRQNVSNTNVKTKDRDDASKKGDADDRKNANVRRDADDKGKRERDEDNDDN